MHIRTGLLALLMVAGSMGIAWQQAAPAAACSCAISTTQEHADFAELVVEGTITEVRPPGGVIVSSSDPTVFTVDVDRVWKGEAASTIEISTPLELGLLRVRRPQEGHDDPRLRPPRRRDG